MQPVEGLTGQVVRVAPSRSTARPRPMRWPVEASLAGGLGVALQAPSLVVGRRGRGVAVRVVAGDAVERVVALGVAAAPGQGRGLEANGHRVVAADLAAARAVALGAELDDPLARGQRRPRDRRVDGQPASPQRPAGGCLPARGIARSRSRGRLRTHPSRSSDRLGSVTWQTGSGGRRPRSAAVPGTPRHAAASADARRSHPTRGAGFAAEPSPWASGYSESRSS